VCQNVHHNDSECLDPTGQPIVAYACQVLETGIGMSLGSRIGYYDYKGPQNERGVTLEYSGGHFGCKVRFLVYGYRYVSFNIYSPPARTCRDCR
jgi:hypothetical protein